MLVDIGLQQGNPVIIGATSAVMCSVFGIGEIIVDGDRHIPRKGTTAIGLIIHVDRHAAMPHQGGDSLSLFGCTSTVAIKVNHIIPFIVSLSKVGAQGLTVPLVGVFARALQRPFPIFHQLGHSCSHATRGAASRHIHVVRSILVPALLHQWLDYNLTSLRMQHAVVFQILPAAKDITRNRLVQLDALLNVVRQLTQHVTQAIGSSLIVKTALAGITEDRRIAVVSSHDDKATVEVENVGRGHTITGAISVGQFKVINRVFGEHGLVLDEIQSQALCLTHLNGLGL